MTMYDAVETMCGAINESNEMAETSMGTNSSQWGNTTGESNSNQWGAAYKNESEWDDEN